MPRGQRVISTAVRLFNLTMAVVHTLLKREVIHEGKLPCCIPQENMLDAWCYANPSLANRSAWI